MMFYKKKVMPLMSGIFLLQGHLDMPYACKKWPVIALLEKAWAGHGRDVLTFLLGFCEAVKFTGNKVSIFLKHRVVEKHF